MREQDGSRIDYGLFQVDLGEPASWEPLILAWSNAYRTMLKTTPSLWRIQLQNGVSYLFDDTTVGASQEHDAAADRESRVVAAWGLSVPSTDERDASRMKGHPRPSRKKDDRGHLFAAASGGGYDINLIPMDSSLNRGWSPEGKTLRRMERYCMSNPGTFFFIRPIYRGDSSRPESFDVGVKLPDRLWIENLANCG